MTANIVWPDHNDSSKPSPADLSALLGQPASAIDTPALVIDLDAMERNLAKMATFARKNGLRLRPHAKMHKSAQLAKLQMSLGAVGVCVQKTEEAERLAAAGVSDIYISNEVVSPLKLNRVVALSERMAASGGQLSIAVDSAPGVGQLQQALKDARHRIKVLVELDVGHGRCGIPPGEGFVALVQRVKACSSMAFAGLQAYHGRAQHVRTRQARQGVIAQIEQTVRAAIASLRAAGIDVPLVSGAGTGCFGYESASGVYGELQVGSYLFMDADYAKNEADPAYPHFEHALFVKTQVMSVSQGHVVCDAGHKSHAIDSGMPSVHGRPDLEYKVGGDEHGIIVGRDARTVLPSMGEVMWLIPGHCDPTVNLHDHMIGLRGARAVRTAQTHTGVAVSDLASGAVERIIAVDARGALR
jgi:D-serine deaminase-like pyridoxal phosphate-dependent protein